MEGDKIQFYIGYHLLALHNYPRQLRSHHSSSEPFTSTNTFESMLHGYILTRHWNIISSDIFFDLCK